MTEQPERVISTPYEARRYRIPSLPTRMAIGVLIFVPMLLLFVGVPYIVLRTLAGYGIHSPISLVTITVVGVVLALLSAAQYVVKPTRAYGPLWIAGTVLTAGYLLSLIPSASFTGSLSNSGSFTIHYGTVLLLLAVVPLLRTIAASILTFEDATRPGERLAYDFPP